MPRPEGAGCARGFCSTRAPSHAAATLSSRKMASVVLLAQLLLALLKGAGGIFTGSMALAISAILSSRDSVSAALVVGGMLGGRNPKVPFALMAASSGLVLLSVIGLGGVILHRLFAHLPAPPGIGAVALALCAAALNSALAWWLARKPDRPVRAVMRGGAREQAKIDLLVAITVPLAHQAGLVDSLVATFIVSLALRSAWRSLRYAAGGLLEANAGAVEQAAIAADVCSLPPIQGVSQLRLMPSPTREPAVALVVHLPAQLSFAQAEVLRPQIERVIKRRLRSASEVLIEYSTDALPPRAAGSSPVVWSLLPHEAGE